MVASRPRAKRPRGNSGTKVEEPYPIVDDDEGLDDNEDYKPMPGDDQDDDDDDDLEMDDQEEAKEAQQVARDEHEVAVGGGRRRSTGSGGEPTSTARAGSSGSGRRSSAGASSIERQQEGRSRGGHTGAAAKVGFVDSETAMARAKRKVEGPSGSTAFLDEPAPPPASPPATPTPTQLPRTDKGPQYELGSDLWSRVFSYLYPSELEAAALVCKAWRGRIYHLPIWKEICEKADLVVPESDLEKYGYERPNYYRLAHENSDMICERCYRSTRPSGAFRALPVQLVDAQVPTEIRMCRDCRVDYYIDHPEPFPDDVVSHKVGDYTVTPRMTKGDAMRAYLLTGNDIMSLPYEMGRNPYFRTNSPMYLFEEQHVLRLARQVHGGNIGIAAARADSEYAGRKVPEPRNDVVQHRRNFLRSLLHDKGLHLPEQSAACHIYIETGRGDPLDIVRDLEAIDWFHRCTNYDPTLDKAHLKQVRRRPRISRMRNTRPQGDTLMSQGSGSAGVEVDKNLQDEIMTEEEEEEDDQHRMAALDDWLQHRLEQSIYRSYKLDPEDDPDRPPKSVWPMLDKIDLPHKLFKLGAERIYRAIANQRHIIRKEGLDQFRLNKGQVKMIVDAPSPGALKRKRESLKTGEGKTMNEAEKGMKEDPKLSTLLEHDFGPDWTNQVVEEAKRLAEARLF